VKPFSSETGKVMNNHIEKEQIQLCRKYAEDCVPCHPESKLGFATETQGLPINGLRHRPEGDANGWFIWRGEELSAATDFFSPLHTRHLVDFCPEALKFLSLPPGYRFLVAGDYEDVWFDQSLLEV
jgi:hypothetical protein